MTVLDRDLRLTITAAVICTLVVLAIPVVPVRALFATPLCLLLPGYALAAAACSRTRLSGVRTLMLTLALSLATLILGALILDLIPGGLNQWSWAVLLLIVVLGGCGIAARRRSPGAAPSARRLISVSRRDLALLGISALLVSAALVVSRIPLAAPNAIGYTQSWMFSDGRSIAPAVQIGLRSAEQRTSVYRVSVTIGSGRPTLVAADVKLRPGAGLQLQVPLFGVPGPQSLVTARIYRRGSPGVYRRLTALITSQAPHSSSGHAGPARS